jgi:3'-phosphoadenosine 5'-phosphosulfate sulfotransferase (PAPS reductase)/FAD synthetase
MTGISDMPEIQQTLFGPGRVVAWFSCGASSAVAAKLAIEHYGRDAVEVAYCDTSASEHPDNARFLSDVERWLGKSIAKLHSPFYRNIYDVFRGVQYLRGQHGAPCTTHMKKNVRKAFQRDSDIHVFGYTVDEIGRRDIFVEANPTLVCAWPLIHHGYTRERCLNALKSAGVEIPAMYRMGYRNNNCIGCVKVGSGYWNKIRVDFPETFKQMSAMERE